MSQIRLFLYFGKVLMADKKSSRNKADKGKAEPSKTPVKRFGRKEKQKKAKQKTSNPVTRYLKGAWAEIRRVTWPDRKEATRLTIGVVVFSVTIAGLISLIDYGFGEAFQRILL